MSQPDESAPKTFGHFTEISYGRTVNLGNFESFRLDMTVEITAEDDPGTAYTTLIKTVDQKCDDLKAKKSK